MESYSNHPPIHGYIEFKGGGGVRGLMKSNEAKQL